MTSVKELHVSGAPDAPEFNQGGFSLKEIKHLGGNTILFKVPADFCPSYPVFGSFGRDCRLLVKQEGHLPSVELLEAPPCTQAGLRIFLEVEGLPGEQAEKIAEAIHPDSDEQPKPGNFTKLMLWQNEERSAAVIFSGNNGVLENIHLAMFDSESGKSEVRGCSCSRASVFDRGWPLEIAVDFSPFQKGGNDVPLVHSRFSGKEFPLTFETL